MWRALWKKKLKNLERNHLDRESAKLDPVVEKAMAQEGTGQELEQWSEYQEGSSA